MAKDGNLKYTSCTPMFAVKIRREVTNLEIREMLNWSKSDEYPGVFFHRYVHGENIMLFEFTDENVAFEFKIRWG